MTLEEMQAEILRLTDINNSNNLAIETFTAEAVTKDKRITDLQENNQKLFLKITAPAEQLIKEEETVSIEDFAKTLKL